MKQRLILLLVSCSMAFLSFGQRSFTPVGGAKKALVIGNAAYPASVGALRNPKNDADDMATMLTSLGFSVTKYTNLTRQQMEEALNQWGKTLRQDDIALFFYAGHGAEVQGQNYLFPINANPQNESQVQYHALPVGLLTGWMEQAQTRTNIILLDACRNNPFLRSFRSSGPQGGLGSMTAPSGTFIGFAASPGAVAADGTGRNGIYTEAILNHISTPNLTIDQIFNAVNAYVRKATEKKQVPFKNSSLEADFVFIQGATPAPQPAPVKKADLLPYEPAMIFVKGGTFNMGSNEGDYEKPVHSVTLSDFWIGKTEVTVGEYLAFCDATNSHYPEWLEVGSSYHITTGSSDHYKKHGYTRNSINLPIVGVNWNDAFAYTEWLSKQTGKSYRLPTEAEWEYAARGGQSSAGALYAGANDVNAVAWSSSNSGDKVHKVATKKANELGLYDMSGNVGEWCSDWWGDYTASSQINPTGASTGTTRVLRGGSWNYTPLISRVANRSSCTPHARNYFFGFRVVFPSEGK